MMVTMIDGKNSLLFSVGCSYPILLVRASCLSLLFFLHNVVRVWIWNESCWKSGRVLLLLFSFYLCFQNKGDFGSYNAFPFPLFPVPLGERFKWDWLLNENNLAKEKVTAAVRCPCFFFLMLTVYARDWACLAYLSLPGSPTKTGVGLCAWNERRRAVWSIVNRQERGNRCESQHLWTSAPSGIRCAAAVGKEDSIRRINNISPVAQAKI